MTTEFPKSADIVIVGVGGIVGSALAHFLAELGAKNIIGLEKAGAIPSDISSTAHASDFVFNTVHDKLTMWTTAYSRQFYDDNGFFFRRGGMEVCRKDDDKRWEELKRKVGSGKAFGSRVKLISAAEAKELFPLVDEDSIRGALWDPDAGLVVPRSQDVVLELVNRAEEKGALRCFTNTPATGFEVEDGKITAVHTKRGTIECPMVVICSGIWGPVIGDMVDVPVPLWPVEHPLLFFGPYPAIKGTDQYLVHPLFRDQGNSAYVRDTGRIEGGLLEWGYYEPHEPRLVDARDIGDPDRTKTSPSMRLLPMEDIADALERAVETVPLLADLPYDERKSFNGLLSVTNDGGSIMGESPEVRGFWLCEAVWVKDGPGAARLCAEWIMNGQPEEMDPHAYDIARFYPAQKDRDYIRGRCYENAQKIYDPPVHPREPYVSGRDVYKSPFYEREVELGGYFDNEIGAWERAYAYKSNEDKLAEYLRGIPVRENEWDRRHVPYEVANAEHLAMSDHVGMINLSHFAIFDIEGPDAERLMETLSVAKVGGNKPVGKAVYTNFLDPRGGVRSDLTVIRLGESKYRVVTGGADGNRDWVYIRNYRDDNGFDADLKIRTHDLATIGLWGPNARDTLSKLTDPADISHESFPFASVKHLDLSVGGQKIPVWALRISYVGELGWELYFDNDKAAGLPIYDALLEAGVVPVGIETYASSRRLEKCFRLQGADLETEFNAYEAGVARRKVKAADFVGKQAYLEQRDQQPVATLCTMTIDDLSVSGSPRYPVGMWPLLDPQSKEVLIDDHGRRSYATSTSYCPSIGKHAVMGYLPAPYAEVGKKVVLEYFNEDGDGHYPMTVEVIGSGSLYDPKNERVRG